MKKNYWTLLFVLTIFRFFGQELDVKVRSDIGQFLLMGFENEVIVSGPSDAVLTCRNCDTLYPVSSTIYRLKPKSRAKITQLILTTPSTTKTFNIITKPIPSPTLFIDGVEVENQTIAVSENAQMSVDYPKEVNLTSIFTLIKWELFVVGKKSLEGKGNSFSLEAQSLLAGLKGSKQQVVILYEYRSVNGLRSRKTAQFIVQ